MRNQMTDFKAFKEFDESISPWKPQFSDSFFFSFIIWKEGTLTPNRRYHHWPIEHDSQKPNPMAWGWPLALRYMVIALLVKVNKKLMGSALTICVPHKQEGLFNSQYMQHFSVNHLTTYEVAISWLPLITYRKFYWVTLTSHGSLVIVI